MLDPAHAVLEQNALLVNTGRHLVLFDTGMGESMRGASRMFGPTTGRLLRNLRKAGINPADIDVVMISHAHCDHCWALVDGQGNRNFPKAQVAISEADLHYWTADANKRGPAFMVPFIEGAKKEPSRLSRSGDHAPRWARGGAGDCGPLCAWPYCWPYDFGHCFWRIYHGFIGDPAHHHMVSLRRPLLAFAYDTDPKQLIPTPSNRLRRDGAFLSASRLTVSW